MNLISIAPKLTEEQRVQYGRLADELIPEAAGMPSATQVGVHTTYIDDALRLRPDLLPALLQAVAALDAVGTPREALIALGTAHEEAFNAVGVLTAGSYYMDDRVRELIRYPGQEARSLVDDTDTYLEMLANVVERGPIYRPVPDEEARA